MYSANKLTDHIITVIYKGYTFRGNCTNEILAKMLAMGTGFVKHYELGNIFGIKKQAITKRVGKWSKKYPEQYALIVKEINIKIEFVKLFRQGLTIFEIANKLGCSRNYAYELKRATIPNESNAKIINMSNRHKRLCKLLFGVCYDPAPKFVDFIKRHIHDVGMVSYYLEGIDSMESVNKTIYIQKVSKIFRANFDIGVLIKNEIICQAKRL